MRTPGQLARRAYRSRAQFFRVFGALIEETPAAMRRRLLLERAAWQLGRTEQSITDVAFDARYGSLEAFTRAFRRAFKISPSLYRRMGATHCHLPAPNAIHFCAPASASEGETMDMYDRILTDVRNRNAWSDTFVDALCEPPETFSYAGMFARDHLQRLPAPARARCPEASRRQGRGIRLPD